jgi:hypothetical protein
MLVVSRCSAVGTQPQHLAGGHDAVDVGELAAIAHAHLAQLRPTLAGTIDQPMM